MEDHKTISKKPAAEKSVDYAFLRKEGLAYVQKLAGEVWTDYNLHDPGVTLLENLCYAITDLGYRTDHPIRDLLESGASDSANYGLVTAAEILPSNPLTLNDFRKLALDCPGIRNAWIETVTEGANEIRMDEGGPKPISKSKDKLSLKGLYRVLLEFEDRPVEKRSDFQGLADLNSTSLWWKIQNLRIEFVFPFWDELPSAVRAGQLPEDPTIRLNALFRENSSDFQDQYTSVIQWGEGEDLVNLPVGVRIVPSSHDPDLEEIINGRWIVRHDKAGEVVETIYHLDHLSWDPWFFLAGLDGELESIEVIRSDVQEDQSVRIGYFIHLQGFDEPLPELDLYLRPEGDLDWTPDHRVFIQGALESTHAMAPIAFKFTVESQVRKALGSVSESELIPTFYEKIAATTQVVEGVKATLHRHRNLCEDFAAFKVVRVQDIGLDAELEVAAETNIELLLSDMMERLDAFFAPAVSFRSLTEMLELKGYSDEAFEGPLLRHGFIDDRELESVTRPEIIYTSDVLRVIMAGDPRIIAVKSLSLANYIKNRLIRSGETEALQLTVHEQYKPRLSIRKSQVVFYRSGIRQVVSENKIDRIVENIKSKRAAQKQRHKGGDLPVPKGEAKELLDYFSIQESLPETYGVGQAGLPPGVPPKRKAQAKQLKGYLSFYDQILVDYLAQLQNVRNLYGIQSSKTPESTFFHASIEAIPGMKELMVESKDSQETEAGKLDRKSRLLDHLLARCSESYADHSLFLNSSPSTRTTSDSNYISFELLEDKKAFLRQLPVLSRDRSRGFNYHAPHIAQLFEIIPVSTPEMNGYGFQLLGRDSQIILSSNKVFWTEKDARSEIERVLQIGLRKGNYHLLREDDRSLDFELLDGDEILASIHLNRIFSDNDGCLNELINYLDDRYAVWDTTNISGFEKRIAALLGIPNPARTTLHRRQLFKGMRFDGKNDGVEISILDSHLTEYTLEVWVRPKPGSSMQCIFDASGRFGVFLSPEGAIVHRYYNPLDQKFDEQQTREGLLKWNEWVHIAVTNNGLAAKVYLNGEELGAAPSRGFAAQKGLQIRLGTDETALRKLAGSLSTIRLLNYASSQEGIESRMLGNPIGKPFGLVACWETHLLQPSDQVVFYGQPEPFKDRYTVDQAEGFHLVEHLLLKPGRAQSAILDDPIANDPYSYTISLVFPAWGPRFSDIDFRKYIEQVIRSEAPAYVSIKIMWLSNSEMGAFETAYRSWLERLARITHMGDLVTQEEQNGFTQRADDLVEVLNRLGKGVEDQAHSLREIKERKEFSSVQDIEFLLRGKFPNIQDLRIIDQTDGEKGLGNGTVIVLVTNRLDDRDPDSLLQPMVSDTELQKIQTYLGEFQPSKLNIRLQVVNPLYEKILVELKITFKEGLDDEKYLQVLNEDINHFLIPWAFRKGSSIPFGGRITKSSLAQFIRERPYVDLSKLDEDAIKIHKVVKGIESDGIGEMVVGENFNVVGDVVTRDLDQVTATNVQTILTAPESHLIEVLETGIGHYLIGLNLMVGKAVGPGIGTMIIGDDFLLQD